jgi:hypothetical protein
MALQPNAVNISLNIESDRFAFRDFSLSDKLSLSQLLLRDENNNLVIVNGSACLRKDLFGLPILNPPDNASFLVNDLEARDCYLVGATMINCWNAYTQLPFWSYQRVDLKTKEHFKPKRRYYASLELSEDHQKAPKQFMSKYGKQIGHLSTMRGGSINMIQDQAAHNSISVHNRESTIKSVRNGKKMFIIK